MPKCKNDSKRSYTGKEPSPKGLGYCAHASKDGNKRKGKDGKNWVVKKIKNGSKRWVKVAEPKKPTGKKYYVHDNGGRPFEVIVNKNKAYIYKRELDPDYIDEYKSTYTKLIKAYTVKKVYPGKSDGKSKATNHGSKNNRYFLGNSVLLQLSANKYVYIGDKIYEFDMKDKLLQFHSPVGPNDVPYPLIVGDKYVYFLLDQRYVDKNMFPKNQKWVEAYTPYFGEFTPKGGWKSKIKDKSKKMRVKIIHKRIW